MSTFNFHPPLTLKRSIFGGDLGVENFRVKNLLLLKGFGEISRGSNKPFKIDHEFLKVPYIDKTVSASSKCTIDNLVQVFDSSSESEVRNFFDKSKLKNVKFHRKIYKELVSALGYMHEGNNVSCFLHLYRIIEQSALCLPVMSIIKEGNLQNTFSEFKSLLEGGAKTDLAVLKKYSKEQLSASPLNTNVNLSFAATNRPKQNVEVVKRFITPVSETNDSVEISYKQMDGLIIGFRNQFFHFLFHDKNLSLEDLEDPEEFLRVCNPYFLNYFSFLFKDLIESEKTLWG